MLQTEQGRRRPFGLVRQMIEWWALAGGLVLVGVVLVNAYSIIAGATINKPFSGDYELTEMGTAIAAFCFLPYCQLVGANVSADLFSLLAGKRGVTLTSLIAAICAVLFAAILIWRMSAGLQDYREFDEFSSLLQIPIWWAYIPTLVSLVLLFLAALITMVDAVTVAKHDPVR